MTTTSKTPVAGRTYPRQQWLKLHGINPTTERIDGHTVMVDVDFLCLGAYSPEQPIQMQGYTITVWHPQNSLVAAHDTVRTKRQVAAAIRRLIIAVDAKCTHPEVRELSAAEARAAGALHFGTCYHVYKCRACGDIYGVDTSG